MLVDGGEGNGILGTGKEKETVSRAYRMGKRKKDVLLAVQATDCTLLSSACRGDERCNLDLVMSE